MIIRMKLTVLGSGTSIPHPDRSSSAYWLEASGGSVLLDCSASAVSRILAEGLAWESLDAIWISHFHLDHCGGLAPLLAGLKHSEKMKARKKPLRIFGGIGLRRLLERFNDVHNYKLFDQPFPLEVTDVEPLEKFAILEGLEAVAMRTPHTAESHAIHLRDSDDAKLVYTSDTGYAETISAFARNVDLLLIEASFAQNKPNEKHLELAEAMHIIRKSKPQRAILTHLYPEWDEVDFAAEVKKYSPICEVLEAKDGLVVEVNRGK